LPSFIIKEDVEDLLSNNVKEEKEISIIRTARSQTTRYLHDGNSNVNFAPVITNS
jgi:predicted alpha/beta superfamily hydrolase